jgi:heme-degrading monooxygenase HmoA
MIKRIVKLTFQPERTADFQEVFAYHKERILVFPGCKHIELLRCKDPGHVFFTLSIWDSEGKTKVLFSDRPEAWTVRNV